MRAPRWRVTWERKFDFALPIVDDVQHFDRWYLGSYGPAQKSDRSTKTNDHDVIARIEEGDSSVSKPPRIMPKNKEHSSATPPGEGSDVVKANDDEAILRLETSNIPDSEISGAVPKEEEPSPVAIPSESPDETEARNERRYWNTKLAIPNRGNCSCPKRR